MRVRGSLILVSLILFASAIPADAAKKKPGGGDSETACVNWCFDHNTTTVSRDKCLNQCECYYHGNLCGRVTGGAMPSGKADHPQGNR